MRTALLPSALVPAARAAEPDLLAARLLTWTLPALFLWGRAPADIALSLVALLFLGHSLRRRRWGWLGTGWVVAALAFWAYLLATAPLAEDPATALDRALPWVRFVVFAAALQHWVLAERAARAVMLGCLLGAVLYAAADALVQLAAGTGLSGHPRPSPHRLSGPFGDPAVGIFLAKASFPALGGLLAWAVLRPSPPRLALALGGVVLVGATVFLSGERSAFLLFSLGLALLAALAPRARRPLLAGAAALGLLLGAAVATAPELRERMVSYTAAQLADLGQTDYGMIFATAWAMWQDHPALGVGANNYRVACPAPRYDAHGPEPRRCQLHPHNLYLELLAETGLVGTLLFLGLIAAWLTAFARGFTGPARRDPAAVGALVQPLLFLWPLIGTQSVFTNWAGTLFWLAIGLALATLSPRPAAPQPAPARDPSARPPPP